MEQHIHNLDVINWLKNGYPATAQGQGGRQVRVGKEFGEIFDHHLVEFTYADGMKLYSHCRHIPNCWSSVSEHAHGTKGTADISAATIRGTDGQTVWEYPRGRRPGGGHQQEHHDLFAVLRKGDVPNEGEWGALSTMTAIMGRMATYSGQEITWDEAINSQVVVSPVDDYHSFDDQPPVLPDANGEYAIPVPGVTKTV